MQTDFDYTLHETQGHAGESLWVIDRDSSLCVGLIYDFICTNKHYQKVSSCQGPAKIAAKSHSSSGAEPKNGDNGLRGSFCWNSVTYFPNSTEKW
jgi:hypothetical protein